MSNYSVIPEKEDTFHVKELPTEQIINTFSTRKEANKFIKQVNAGRAFNGWTPYFFNVKGIKPN